MKNIFLLIALFVVSISFSVQPNTETIIKAFKTADASEIGFYFDDFIDLKFFIEIFISFPPQFCS